MIQLRSFGTQGTGTTTTITSPTMPAGWRPGDMLILVCSSKATTPPTLTTPSGWTAPSNNTITGGTGVAGTDAGPNRITLLYREAVAGDAAPTVTFSASPSPGTADIIAFTKGFGESWSAPTCSVGADTTGSTTSYGTTAAAVTLTGATNDVFAGFDAINGDIGTPTVPGTMTATGGTFETLTNIMNTPTTTGNDARIIGVYQRYVSGTITAGFARAITWTSGGTSTSGCSVFVKLSVTGTEWKIRQPLPNTAIVNAANL